MTAVFILCTALLTAGVVVLAAVLIKNLLAPQKLETIEKLIRNGKQQQAIKLAKSVIAKSPHDAEAHYMLGKAYLADHKPELALMEMKAVNSAGAFSAKIPEQEFRQIIAKLYLRFNQYDEALKEYLLLIKRNPRKADYYFMAGELFEQRENTDQAVAYYRKAVDLDPHHAAAHAALGFLLYRAKQNVPAEQEIATALKLDPQNAKAHFYSGRIFMGNHEYGKAVAAFEKAMRSPELKQKALIERGRCYMEAGNYDKAKVEFTSAIKNQNTPAAGDTLYARYFLAACCEKQRDIDGAVAQWAEIQKQKKNFLDVNDKLQLYQSATTNDRMKEYLTAGKEDFPTICRTVVTDYLKLVPSNIKETKYGCVVLAAENDEGMLNMRKMPKYIVFYRDPNFIEDNFLRNLQEIMKKQSVVRATVLTSSGFTRGAVKFAENRPLDLIGPEKLENILASVNPFAGK